MLWPVPMQFIDRPPGQNERCARTGDEMTGFACRENFVRDSSAQYDVYEVFEVFVVRNDARGNGVILDGNTAPSDGGTGQHGLRAQEWLNPSLPLYFDTRNNRMTGTGPT